MGWRSGTLDYSSGGRWAAVDCNIRSRLRELSYVANSQQAYSVKVSVTNPVQSSGKSSLSNNTSSSLVPTSSRARLLLRELGTILPSTDLCTGKLLRGTERVNLVMSRFSSDVRPTQHQSDTDFFGGIWVTLSGRAVHLTDRKQLWSRAVHLLHDPCPQPCLPMKNLRGQLDLKKQSDVYRPS